MKGRKIELTAQTSEFFAEEREGRPYYGHNLAAEYSCGEEWIGKLFPARMRHLVLFFLDISQSFNENFTALLQPFLIKMLGAFGFCTALLAFTESKEKFVPSCIISFRFCMESVRLEFWLLRILMDWLWCFYVELLFITLCESWRWGQSSLAFKAESALTVLSYRRMIFIFILYFVDLVDFAFLLQTRV